MKTFFMGTAQTKTMLLPSTLNISTRIFLSTYPVLKNMASCLRTPELCTALKMKYFPTQNIPPSQEPVSREERKKEAVEEGNFLNKLFSQPFKLENEEAKAQIPDPTSLIPNLKLSEVLAPSEKLSSEDGIPFEIYALLSSFGARDFITDKKIAQTLLSRGFLKIFEKETFQTSLCNKYMLIELGACFNFYHLIVEVQGWGQSLSLVKTREFLKSESRKEKKQQEQDSLLCSLRLFELKLIVP